MRMRLSPNGCTYSLVVSISFPGVLSVLLYSLELLFNSLNMHVTFEAPDILYSFTLLQFARCQSSMLPIYTADHFQCHIPYILWARFYVITLNIMYCAQY